MQKKKQTKTVKTYNKTKKPIYTFIHFFLKYKKFILIILILIIAIPNLIIIKRKNISLKENNVTYQLIKTELTYTKLLKKSNYKTAYNKIKKSYLKIIDTINSNNVAKIGLINLANMSYNAGELKDAIEIYNKALKICKQNSIIKITILHCLAHSYLSNYELHNSVYHFEQIISGSSSIMKEDAILNNILIYKKIGNNEKTTDLYEKFMSNYKNSFYSKLMTNFKSSNQ